MSTITLVFEIQGEEFSDSFLDLLKLHGNGMKMPMFGHNWKVADWKTSIKGPVMFTFGEREPHYVDQHDIELEILFNHVSRS